MSPSRRMSAMAPGPATPPARDHGPTMPRLLLTHAGTSREIHLGRRPITVGRHPRNEIVIDEDTLSRRHCVFEPHLDGWRLRDLSSRNGTRINGRRILEQSLEHGDLVHLGSAVIRYVDPDRAHRVAEAATGGSRRELPDADVASSGAIVEVIPPEVRLARGIPALEVSIRRLVENPLDGPLDSSDTRLRIRSEALGRDAESEANSIIRLFQLLLGAARRARATDLHFDPREEAADLRLRVDGAMLDPIPVERPVHDRIVRCVRVLCALRDLNRPELEEGHFAATIATQRVDYRVSLAPTMHGTKLALRVLDSRGAPQRLEDLGLHPWMEERLRVAGERESGFVLAAGPTGAGKTTTLYSCLRGIDASRRNVVTIEDPVEYEIERCTQIPVDTSRGRDFASLLRSVLRQDPDVILVGEVRDLETATVAMQSAMTGHLVYSTTHAKDTIQAVFRLLDLGVDRSLAANALDVIVAQRLIRALCTQCRRPVRPTTAQSRRMHAESAALARIFVPVGCPACLRTGFHGRRAVFELLSVTDQIRDEILGQPTIHRIRALAEQGLFTRLADFGYRLVAEGVTSFDEVARIESPT